MKNILIIYPHWVPSNLAGVHRPRLIANFLPDLGWHPIVLTVSPEFYEEKPDPQIIKIASEKIEVIYTKALNLPNPRLIGDIGLRAFPFLLKKALKIISAKKIDFIWIPVPSFYTALLGRILYHKTNTPYGIDYIDPWIRDISNRKNLRLRLSILLAHILEPIAVKRASLISGVSTAYYLPVIQRNFKKRNVAHIGMPYGFDSNDHQIIIKNLTYPWQYYRDIDPIVYAGAFLPNSKLFLKSLFKVLKLKLEKGNWDVKKKFFFLGTGLYSGTTIADYAEQYGLTTIVHEIRERLPYLYILNFLAASHSVLILGSTERHYTASKTFQALLSKRPVFAIFHYESSAVSILEKACATNLLVKYKDEEPNTVLEEDISLKLDFLTTNNFSWQPDFQELDKFSARASAKVLISKLKEIL